MGLCFLLLMIAPLKLLLIAGARPNFMKIAPLIHAIQRHNTRTKSEIGNRKSEIIYRLVHTGQHYDEKMSEVFFRELGIPAPDINLEVGSGSHAVQTANIMTRFEPVLLNAFQGSANCPTLHASDSQLLSPNSDSRSSTPAASAFPDWLVVVGDVNSTLACTLVASKLGVKVAHVEAGLRSFDRTMPEEINRLVTDALADLLLTPSEDANENLRREGVPDHKVRLVGNVMIDTLIANLPAARQSQILQKTGVTSGHFVYVTLHRPSNVDQPENLRLIMTELAALASKLPVVFPIHPRTRHRLAEFGLAVRSSAVSSPPLDVERSMLNVECSLVPQPALLLIEPVGYHDSLCLTENARLVLTDSGGLQEESTWFRTPCLTLRPNTERPVTVTVGSNRLTNPALLGDHLSEVFSAAERLGTVPPLWDGQTAERILSALLENTSNA